jgi:twitching motility protein PilI
MIQSLPQIHSDIGDPYLRLQLDSQTQAVLPMNSTQEVLVVPRQRITSLPNMSAHVIGLVSRRNRIYWLIDLPLLLGLNFNSKNVREYNVAFIEIDKVSVGLAIQKIKGVSRIDSEKIMHSPDNVKEQLVPYINGYIVEEQQLIYILNPIAIIHKK